MTNASKQQLTINISEDLLRRLQERAEKAEIDVEAVVLSALAREVDTKLDSIEEELLHIEKLMWQNLYWSTLPYLEGLPKHRLSNEGLSLYWEKSNTFSSKYFDLCRASEAQDEPDSEG